MTSGGGRQMLVLLRKLGIGILQLRELGRTWWQMHMSSLRISRTASGCRFPYHLC
jgi:hypothetical protein